MGDTIVKLYQKQNFVIGEDILKAIKKNELTLDEALLIIYFVGNNNHPILDIDEIKSKFGMEELSIMQAFASITNKNLINIRMEKNREGKVEEVIDLTPFFESIAMDMGETEKKRSDESIFELFEKQLARPLSPIEFDLINKWFDRGESEELIVSALNEAVYNGTFTLRYIDAILTEWSKKGLKSAKDVNIYIKNRRKPRERKNQDFLNFDFNWLEDEN